MIRRFREILFFVLFVLLQTMVISHIRLFGIVTPFIYLYVIIKLRIDISRSYMIILSFLLGLTIDIFSNTFGIHAAACSLIGFIRNPLLERFVDMRELPEGSVPSYQLLGFGIFFRYALILVSLHHIVLFSIDAFGFSQPMWLLIRLSSSMILSLLLIFIIESFSLRVVKHGE